ncbi:LacI family transcriptional regulator [Kribbella turkmenica]|uniref:LacI family transcriptional regulator n=1 Tax=Kribbella turkmenica TaxID=2530375 RepID=A0A4R4X9A8_9ACTN|nr:LacI family DNA-binding transcriptional regulator [Kribbella turkmenica]TDD27084.1 LacI family transcriptional regulator [Kribbella turkmenica]
MSPRGQQAARAVSQPAQQSVRRPTVQDVAREAGVSPSTVSRALHTRGYASPDVRARVRAAAERIGYVLDHNARNLRSRTSTSIGVLISDLRNPFYADLAAGIEEELRAAEYQMVLVNDNGDPAEEMRAAETLLAMRVPGVIVTPVTAKCPRVLQENGVHVVCADRELGRSNGDVVMSDNKAGARELTDHLIALGHTRIGLLIDETKWSTGAGRLAGFRAAHLDNFVDLDEDLIAYTSFDADAARETTRKLLNEHEVTAIISANNVLAQGALAELKDRRLRIPRQISLAAYDDVPWMSLVQPALTTVDQHTVELGRSCARLLLARIRGDLPARRRIVRVPARLIVRGSTGPAPRG